MKQFFIIFGLLIISHSAFSQFNWETQFGYSNLKHSQMNGISFTNSLRYHVGEKSSFFVGGHLNYAEGNRNVDLDANQTYSFSFGDYVPEHGNQGFPFDYWQEFDVTTSTSYQISSTLGYGYDIHLGKQLSLTLDGGIFLTYVNKTYIAAIIEDAQLTNAVFGFDMEYDLAIPFYLRYYDVGTFLRASLILFEGKNISIGASSAYYFPSNSDSWLDADLLLRFKI